MTPRVIVAVILLLSLQDLLAALDRNATKDEYQPDFNEIKDNLTALQTSVTGQVGIINDNIAHSVTTAQTAIETLIQSVKDSITAAKDNGTRNTTCLDAEDTKLGAIKSSSITDTCSVSIDVDISDVIGYLDELIKVPDIAIENCENLNPIVHQDDSYLTCIIQKIIDLQNQHQYLDIDIQHDIAKASQSVSDCLADQIQILVTDITQISVDVDFC